jgi:hypothetical protein
MPSRLQKKQRRHLGSGMCHHKVEMVISSALMRMVRMVPPLGAPPKVQPALPSQLGNGWMALGPRPSPSQRTRMTQVLWRASSSHPSTQCGGIMGYSRPTYTTISQRQWASCGQGQVALWTARDGNANRPYIRPICGKARPKNWPTPESPIPKSKKGRGQQLIFLCGWHVLGHDERNLRDVIWTKDMRGQTKSCRQDRDQVDQECRNERD